MHFRQKNSELNKAKCVRETNNKSAEFQYCIDILNNIHRYSYYMYKRAYINLCCPKNLLLKKNKNILTKSILIDT